MCHLFWWTHLILMKKLQSSSESMLQSMLKSTASIRVCILELSRSHFFHFRVLWKKSQILNGMSLCCIVLCYLLITANVVFYMFCVYRYCAVLSCAVSCWAVETSHAVLCSSVLYITVQCSTVLCHADFFWLNWAFQFNQKCCVCFVFLAGTLQAMEICTSLSIALVFYNNLLM